MEIDRFQDPHRDHVDDLCESERVWLKEHWGDEFPFLLEHQLTMYDKNERREGRFIMRKTMASESDQRRKRQEGGHEDCTAGSQQHALEELGDHYNSLFADQNFSGVEHEWINGRYGDLKTFLNRFRHKLHEPDGIKQSKKHLQWLIWIEGKLKEAPAFLGIR
ncbi:hypothetical protein CDV36_006144 [Fusarium kuroshium]|uniref:Uncharacterized protein n=1 Tax=Fusarium kuroshium TaxID=2010991 RepID=A0A3M2S9F8_9HYPO|nr:hypothetical protein CDV36_006144 [Fusarium kuroshium]